MTRRMQARVVGLARHAGHLRERRKPQPNDPTLADKVRSEVFRDPRVPKGSINVMAEDGTVLLHGRVDDPDLLQSVERRVKRVQGVQDVESHLHGGPR